jgi:hypothetical protein
MTVDTSDLTVHRIDEVLIHTVGVPSPHPRGRDASTGNGPGSSRRRGAVTVHLAEVGMTLDAFNARR